MLDDPCALYRAFDPGSIWGRQAPELEQEWSVHLLDVDAAGLNSLDARSRFLTPLCALAFELGGRQFLHECSHQSGDIFSGFIECEMAGV